MKIIIAIVIFSAIILFHELGHFLFAKLNKIVVTEFSLGMGPRLFSFEKGDTRYSLKLLPIGGSCAMLGEDTDEEDEPGTFNSAPVGGRIAVVAAGPVFNAANELAVRKFLQRKIGFLDIYEIIGQSMSRHTVTENPDLDQILEIEKETYQWIEGRW